MRRREVSLVGFLVVFVLVLVGAAAQNLGQGVPDAAHEERTEQVLEGYEGIMDAEQYGRQLQHCNVVRQII